MGWRWTGLEVALDTWSRSWALRHPFCLRHVLEARLTFACHAHPLQPQYTGESHSQAHNGKACSRGQAGAPPPHGHTVRNKQNVTAAQITA